MMPTNNQRIPHHLANVVQEICRHEAGHYVIGRALGFQMSSCTIQLLDRSGAHAAHCTVTLPRSLTTLNAVRDYLDQRIQMLYAGSLAQSLNTERVNVGTALEIVEKGGGRNDFDKLRELLHLLRDISHADACSETEAQQQLDRLNEDLWATTARTVEQEFGVIDALGRLFHSRVTHLCQEFTIEAGTIDALPEIVERFGMH